MYSCCFPRYIAKNLLSPAVLGLFECILGGFEIPDRLAQRGGDETESPGCVCHFSVSCIIEQDQS